jgi:hypothetical protein
MIRAFARALVEQHGDLFKADVRPKKPSEVAGLLRRRLPPFTAALSQPIQIIREYP